MQRFSSKDIADLAAWHQDPSVSFFLPTRRSTKEVQQGAIRLKNLVREANEQLIAAGKRPAEARQLLEPVRKLIEDHGFWQHQKDGLVVFVSPDFFRHYKVARNLAELAVAARRFHVRPLLPLLSGDAEFYVLGLGQNQVQLYEVGIDGIDEVEMEALPESLREIVKERESERQLQFHTRTPGVQGRPAVFHGHGEDAGAQKETISQLFREIDKELRDYFGPNPPPLILAGVDYYFPLYREVSRYPRLVDEGIAGSVDQLRPEALHREAWRIAKPIINRDRDSAIERYGDLTGTGKTLKTIDQIVAAAHGGRIDTLFVNQDEHRWGTYDPAKQRVNQELEPTADNEDLLDLAAVQTLLNSGTIYMADKEQMPDSEPAAAILRY